MIVLQLIDSLEAGGAERMAVNIANALSNRIEGSYLCATRKEGILKDSLNNKVNYTYLKKTSTLDYKSILKLRNLIKTENIEIIHAHSTSFFLATIVKVLSPELKIIWHDHYGNSENIYNRKFKILRFCSRFFTHIISVNNILADWAKQNMKAKRIDYLPNFAVQDTVQAQTKLFGNTGMRILHLANLRPQKDHETLLNSFFIIVKKHPNWTLHCVGMDFNDTYSSTLKKTVRELGLSKNVFFYGSKSDIKYIISQCDIGVLSSKSEGLPIALLEYGLSKLPVVATNVGSCNEVISNVDEGVLVEPKNHKTLSKAILKLIGDLELREKYSENLHLRIVSSFSESSVLESLINIYEEHKK